MGNRDNAAPQRRRREPSTVNGQRRCYGCGRWFPLEAFHKKPDMSGGRDYRCLECKRKSRRTAELRRYGLTVAAYDRMLLKQDGVCAICRRPPQTTGRKRWLHVDHDHETGRIRGLLCHTCNTAVGLLQEDVVVVEALLRYLKQTDSDKVGR